MIRENKKPQRDREHRETEKRVLQFISIGYILSDFLIS
jgi:hypothetical protein